MKLSTIVAEKPHNATSAEALIEPSQNGEEYLVSWQLVAVTLSLCLGTFLVALDINIIGVAVPKITAVFNSLEDSSWYATAYLLTVTAFQPTMGSLYKYFDTRTVYLINIAVFEVGSIICAVAESSTVFILGRAIAGLGAAGLLQGALASISLIVPLQKRPALTGVVLSVFGLSVCVGPTMGGAFVDTIGWRWCFWINLPIGAVAVAIFAAFYRTKKHACQALPILQKLRHMDAIGTILFLGAVCSLVISLQWGGQIMPWSSPKIIGLLVTFFILTVCFCISQWMQGEKALLPLRILRVRSILVGTVFLFFTGMFNYTYSFYLPFYFQAAQDVSPVTSGVRIIPFVIAQIAFIGIVGFLVSRYGHYMPYMIIGMVVCVLGTGLITRLDTNTPTIQWAAFLVLAGAGLGTAMQLPYTALQIALTDEDIPVGNAIFVFFNQLGGMIAIPIAQSIFLSRLRTQLAVQAPELNVEQVIAAGAANLRILAGSSVGLLMALKMSYSIALYGPFVLALAATCAAGACVVGMEWKNLKIEAERRKQARVGTTTSSQVDDPAATSPGYGNFDSKPEYRVASTKVGDVV